MTVVHAETDDVLATEVEVADGWLATFRGLRFRSQLPADTAMVFPYDGVGRRDVDMLFVAFPIDVLWLVDGRIERVNTLRSWIGFGLAKADCVVELPAGTADAVAEGDRVEVRL